MMHRSPGRRIARFFLFGVLALCFLALFGFVVMSLWNWLTPALFGWKAITYAQAFGLVILCRLLFGGMGSPHRRCGGWRSRMKERWERMTPEERQKFREGMRGCWGPIGKDEPEAQPNA